MYIQRIHHSVSPSTRAPLAGLIALSLTVALGACAAGDLDLGAESELGDDAPLLADELISTGKEDGEAMDSKSLQFTITPGYQTYVPPHYGSGDEDFHGNGPQVWSNVSLEIRNTNQLWASIYMRARETQSDWTEARGTTERLLYTHSTAIEIVSDSYSSTYYVDNDHSNDYMDPGAGEVVNYFYFVGDTNGDEAGTDTRVDVHFNGITLREVRDSCAGNCGASAGSCWCDASCTSYGDCCADACSVCGAC